MKLQLSVVSVASVLKQFEDEAASVDTAHIGIGVRPVFEKRPNLSVATGEGIQNARSEPAHRLPWGKVPQLQARASPDWLAVAASS